MTGENSSGAVSASLLDVVRCGIKGHDWGNRRARDYDPEGYSRTERIGEGEYHEYPIPGCEVVSMCQRCGEEATTSMAVQQLNRKHPNIPRSWDPDETPSPHGRPENRHNSLSDERQTRTFECPADGCERTVEVTARSVDGVFVLLGCQNGHPTKDMAEVDEGRDGA